MFFRNGGPFPLLRLFLCCHGRGACLSLNSIGPAYPSGPEPRPRRLASALAAVLPSMAGNSSTRAQAGACEVQMVAAGLARLGSSSVPARTKMRWGRASAVLNRCTPHCGQKRRCIVFPLSAMLTKSLVFPEMTKPFDGKHTLTAALPAAMYWQKRHQQSLVKNGAASASYRTALHRQPPETLI